MTKRLIKLTILSGLFLLLASQAWAAITLTINYPANGQFINRAAWGSGIRLSATSNAGEIIQKVWVGVGRPYTPSVDNPTADTRNRYWSASSPLEWRPYSGGISVYAATAGTPPAWTWNSVEDNFFIDGVTYSIRSGCYLSPGSNWLEGPTSTFTYDNANPSSPSFTAVASPTKTIPNLSIRTSDQHTGIKYIKSYLAYIGSDGNNYYYNGSSWVRGTQWLPLYDNTTSTPAPGTDVVVAWAFPTLTSGCTYYYQIRIMDLAGNYSESITRTFLYDNTPPQASISSFTPSIVNYYSTTAGKLNGATWDRTIRGTASDPSISSGLTQSNIRLTISRTTTGTTPYQYFNGTTWVSDSSTTVPVSTYSSPNWTHNNSSLFSDAATGYVYTFTIKATDQAGNQSIPSPYSLKIDNENPTSTISTPSFFSTYPTSIIGTATDNTSGSGVSYVQLGISRTRGATIQYWRRPSSLSPTPSWQNTSIETLNVYATVSGTGASRNWSYDSNALFGDPQPGDVFAVTSKAIDGAGNVQSAVTSKTIQLDSTIPTVNITSPRSSFNNASLFDRITISATGGASGLSSVQIKVARNTQFWSWTENTWTGTASSWQTVSGTGGNYVHALYSNFHNGLTEGSTYTIYAKAITSASPPVTIETSHSIIYDNTPPQNPHLDPPSSSTNWQNGPAINITWTGANDPAPASGSVSGLPLSGVERHSIQIIKPSGTIINGNPRSLGDLGYDFEFNPILDLSSYRTGSIFEAFGGDFGAWDDGIYQFQIKTYDKAGNSSNYETIYRIGIDTFRPTLSINYPSNGETINTTAPTFRWTAGDQSPGSGLEYFEMRLYEGTTLMRYERIEAPASSFALPAGILANGAYTITMQAFDHAGNDLMTDPITFTVSTSGRPVIRINSPSDGTSVASSSITVSGAAQDESRVVSVQIKTGTGAYREIWSGSQQSVDWTGTATLSTGPNTIYVKAVDDAGIENESSISVTCDTDAPSAFNLIYPANNGWTTPTPTFKWERSIDRLSGLRGYDLYIDRAKVNSEPIIDEAYPATSALSGGDHSFYVVARDNAGNSRSSDIFFFKVDSVAPSAFTITAPTEGQYIEAAFDVAWTRSTDSYSGIAAYEVHIDGEKKAEATSTTANITKVPADGNHTIHVVAQDVAGNTTRSNTVNITTNPHAPAIALYINDKTIASGNKINSLPNIKAQITDNSGIDPTSIKILIDGQAQGAAADLQAAQVRAATVTAYDARKNDVRLKSGKHTIKVEAKDVFGKETILELTDLDVLGKAVLEGKPMNFPNPFKPSLGQTTSINYTLLDDVDIKINIYDLSGRLVLVKICNAGTEGGRFGENNVAWDGKSLYGEIQANGVYVYLIATTKGEVIGSGEIAIYE